MYCEVLIGKLAHDVGISESRDQGTSNNKALNRVIYFLSPE